MFIGVTGEPGSGKSAYAVDFALTHKEEYKNVYVNINGFKMHDNINALNFPYLYDVLTKCKEIYDTQVSTLGNTGDDNVIDEPIKEYLLSIDFISINPKFDDYTRNLRDRKKESYFKRTYLNMFSPIKFESQYLPTLFIIDEVQNHMGAINPATGKEERTADPILSWWVSYHRHLYMDVLILSQQYQKIHISYRRDISYFLDGIESQSLALGKFSPHFVYNKHKESPYSEKNKTAKVKVKKRKELFAAYDSGDAVRTKSVILPWVFFSLFFLAVVAVIFSYVLSTFGGNIEDDNVTKPQSTIKEFTKIQKSNNVNTDYSNFTYIKLKCVSDICINKLHKIELNVDELNTTITHTKSQFLTVKKYSQSLGFVTILATKDFINLFQGADNGNKQTDKGFSILN